MKYKLKEFVHDMGLSMREFRNLDAETQEKWRKAHQRKIEKMKENEIAYVWTVFCEENNIISQEFFDIPDKEQSEWIQKFEAYLVQYGLHSKNIKNIIKGVNENV